MCKFMGRKKCGRPGRTPETLATLFFDCVKRPTKRNVRPTLGKEGGEEHMSEISVGAGRGRKKESGVLRGGNGEKRTGGGRGRLFSLR